MMKKSRRLFVIFCCCIYVIQLQGQITWTQAAPGVWKGVAGEPDKYDLIKAAGSMPATAALTAMKPATFPLPQTEISATMRDGKTYLRFPLVRNEQVFG